MGLTSSIAIVILAAMAGASFFFAVAESALFSLGKWRALQLKERYPVLGQQALELLESPQDLLATIVLGNTAANAGLVAVSLWGMFRWNWPIVLTPALLLLVILIGCEVIPKTLAVRAPEFWTIRLVRPILLLQRLSRPVRQIAQLVNALVVRAVLPASIKPQRALTDAEYEELLELAFQQGALARSEKEIILQIIRLDRQTAKDVMKPRSRMNCISDDLSVEEMMAAARKFKHTRLPVFDETPDTIVGILNTQALLLDPSIDLADVIEFPSFVPESMNLLQLLNSLQRQKRGLAIVMDEFGGTAGLVTLGDILEEVLGKVREDTETGKFIMDRLGPGKWRVSGAMRVEDFQREYPDLGTLEDVDTIGGLLVNQMEVVPGQGESVLFRGLRLTAQVADERRVREVLVEVAGKGAS